MQVAFEPEALSAFVRIPEHVVGEHIGRVDEALFDVPAAVNRIDGKDIRIREKALYRGNSGTFNAHQRNDAVLVAGDGKQDAAAFHHGLEEFSLIDAGGLVAAECFRRYKVVLDVYLVARARLGNGAFKAAEFRSDAQRRPVSAARVLEYVDFAALDAKRLRRRVKDGPQRFDIVMISLGDDIGDAGGVEEAANVCVFEASGGVGAVWGFDEVAGDGNEVDILGAEESESISKDVRHEAAGALRLVGSTRDMFAPVYVGNLGDSHAALHRQ